MGKYVRWITYKGKEILFLDGPGLSDDEGVVAWGELAGELLKERAGSLILIDGTNDRMSTASVRKAKEAAAVIKGIPDNRTVFVGVTGLQKSTVQLVARGMGLNVHFAGSIEEAKEWLVKEDNQRL